jgi:hypothetical protein
MMKWFWGKLKRGDRVEVLPLEEIVKTLDEKGRSGGLKFVRGMQQFCGKQFRVLKKVRTIFDARASKMVGLRNAVILEDVICKGRDSDGQQRCDRCCFYYWKENWLRKI